MNELTIEEKAKRYDEAIALMQDCIPDENGLVHVVPEEIFPELAESEDEKIRKEILDYIIKGSESLYDVQQYGKERFEKWIAWLEKQGEHQNFRDKIQIGDQVTRNEDGVLVNLSQLKRVAKPADVAERQGYQKPVELQQDMLSQEQYAKAVDECIYGEQKLVDKIEQKFNVGEWIYHEISGNAFHINRIENRTYISDEGATISFGRQNDWRLWTIQDAKDGDVLICGVDKRPFIFKGLLDTNHPNYPVAYCGINLERDFHISLGNHWWTNDDTQPATKEQCDLLFQKMKETGYEWDAEHKQLKNTPIFHIGDRVRYKGYACDGVITEITDADYICGHAKLPISTQDELELVK